MILKTAETKFVTKHLSDTTATQVGPGNTYDLNHNTIFAVHIYNNANPDAVKHPLPGQGDADSARNGDEIYATGLLIRGMINAAAGNKNTRYRMFISEYNDTQFGTGTDITTYNALFHSISAQSILDNFQTDRIKVRSLGTLTVGRNDQQDSDSCLIPFKFWIPLKRKLTFRDDTTFALAKGMKNKLTLLCIPYRLNQAAQGSVGSISTNATLYYKDP